MIQFRRPTFNMIVIAALGIASIAVVTIVVWLLGGPKITVTRNILAPSGPTSPLTGLPCQRPDQRPVAVMIGSDPEARPLSGLAAADMVFEMPVTPNGITRLMAVYQCSPDPKEIGSIRSARQDFIPLAQGLAAIYAHWGGEHGALENLDKHVINNINALYYDGTVFYRKKNIPAPQNGFSTLNLLRTQATTLGYVASTSMSGYLHEKGSPGPNLGGLVDHVEVSWPQGMDVAYRYDGKSNTYARWRGGTPEIEGTTGLQVKVAVVVVIKTTSTFLRDQYITVQTLGQGTADIYQNGQRIAALWQKQKPTDMLALTDAAGHPIALAPGPIWVEIDAPLPAVSSQ